MAKSQNTSGVNAGTFDSNLNNDIERFHRQPNQWTHARNAVTNTIRGDIGDLSNEASNYLCKAIFGRNGTTPLTIIGAVYIQADEWVIFSTNNIESEIGLFTEGNCSYTKIVNDPCLAFNTQHLIIGVGRTAYNCGRRVYWDDGINPSRVLDIDNVPWVQNCQTVDSCQICTDTTELDCDKIRLAPLVKDLSFRLAVGNASGQILNGSYYVVGAYLVEGQRVTDYSLPSNIQGLFTHQNMASSLDIFVEEADPEFDEFELILVQFTNFNTVAKRVGVYSTRQTKITIDHINDAWPAIDPGNILIQNPIPEKSDAMYRSGEYLIRSGITNKFDFNYQPLANQIVTKWVSVEYPADYYYKGGTNTGYMRDEVYSFFIRWVYDTGDKSKSYHIPGRAAIPTDKDPVAGADVLVDEQGNIIDNPVRWEVYNTARVQVPFPGTNTILPDGGKILGGGDMGYWESTEIYDDDKPEVWNASSNPIWGSVLPKHDLCGKPIRHHKFPDNATDDVTGQMITNHYDPADGRKIRIMGVQFDNIKVPLDNEGHPITNIVGYEILRGSREGWKTVLAKGMVNNLRQYVPVDETPDKYYLYPNYPYNPKEPFNPRNPSGEDNPVVDHFLSSTPTKYNRGTDGFFGLGADDNEWNQYLDDDTPLGVPNGLWQPNEIRYFDDYTNIKKNLLTFHSPETNFRNPYLSAKELKVYGELRGNMEAKFHLPKDHPRHKFITDTAFVVSALLGIGYAMLKTQGERTTSYTAPQINYGGTYTQFGPDMGTTGLYGPSAASAFQQIIGMQLYNTTQFITDNLTNYNIASLIMSLVGTDPNTIKDSSSSTSGQAAGATGAVGGQAQYSHNMTPWAALPLPLKLLTGGGVPSFLTFWAEGVDSFIELIYAFTSYKHYALQQISHCFYNTFYPSRIGQIRRAVEHQSYLDPELQDFADDYRINNIFRSRTVALKLTNDLELPEGVDDTQKTFSEVWGRGIDEYWQNVEHIDVDFREKACSYYTGLKQRIANQYGQIENIIQVPVSTSYTDKVQTRSDVHFNGDIYITRYTEKNTMFFFYDWLKGQPDGAGWDYKLRKMIPHPRFWMDTDPFDVAEFVSSLGDIFQNNAHDVPANFDPFMYENSTDSDNDGVPDDGECNCLDTTNCYHAFDTGDLEDYCDLQEEVYQLNLYIDFLEDCACFVDTGSGGCNDDGNMSDPVTDITYQDYFYEAGHENPNTGEMGPIGGCGSPNSNAHIYSTTYGNNGLYYSGCGQCPGWANASEYNDDQTGKWARKIKRVKRKLNRAVRKLNRLKNQLYDQYLESINIDQDGWLQSMLNRLVTPRDKYAFDMRTPGALRFTVKEAYMYLFNSGVRDFYVESEINNDYRDWGDVPEERHYSHWNYTNLKELFSTDHIKVGNFMKYDYSLSIGKLFNNYVSWGMVQQRGYDPFDAEKCYVYQPKRVMYSLPQYLENKKDNWRVFLPLNYKDFTSVVTAFKSVGKNGALILFQDESPVQFIGVDQLETDMGTKITIGDGGLFSQPSQSVVNVDYPLQYGSCQNRLSAVNTPAGLYFISQNQGKIFQVADGLREISAMGRKWWFAKYLPYKLTQHPTAFQNRPFELMDNPVVGIGCQTIYDSENSIVFFCKKDWEIRDDIADTLTYIGGTTFVVNMTPKGNGLRVQLGDPRYFRNASWTMSWDPKAGEGGAWISAHDWHPDLVIPSKHTYLTTKDNGIWVHANRCDSYCNFYGVDYPFEIEHTLLGEGTVSTLRNVVLMMEVYVYDDNCDDRYHVLDFGFDEAVVYNSEQCSGLLRLNLQPKNNAPEIVTYPRINATYIDILYSKEEQKYRFNQFYDITDDRGEFNSAAQRRIFITEPNGYVRQLNQANLNYSKFQLEHKKFRHYRHSVLLRRRVSGNHNMIVSIALQTNLNSPR